MMVSSDNPVGGMGWARYGERPERVARVGGRVVAAVDSSWTRCESLFKTSHISSTHDL